MWKMNRKNQRAAAFFVSLFLIMNMSLMQTMAYLITQANPVVNTFLAATVPNEITEEFDGYVKNNVKVKNVGDADAYIRVKVIAVWEKVDENGNAVGIVHASKPVYGQDFIWSYQNKGETDTQDYISSGMEQVGSGWVLGDDGYYYYTKKVACEEGKNSTDILFTNCKVLIDTQTGKTPNQPNGYKLCVEILSQSIQADGVTETGSLPVTEAWGVETDQNGMLKIGGEG